jgi:hypothetical protein
MRARVGRVRVLGGERAAACAAGGAAAPARGGGRELVADGLAVAAEVRHQRWLREQWREVARGDGAVAGVQ